MEGLEHHQRHYLAKLEDTKTPIDKQRFVELVEAEKRLGPAENIETERHSRTMDFGITISMSVSGGARRKGFEKLRDIITRYQRLWTQNYFEQYLKSRWENEISQAANTFFPKMSEKGGKPPTIKQFVSTASLPTKNWFGGDISLLYTAIGEKIPFVPQKQLLMPKDKIAFVKNVAKLLPPKDFDYFGQSAGEYIQKQYIEDLAIKALNVIQLYEAIGQFPKLIDFSTKFKNQSAVLHANENQAWEIYASAIKEALQLDNMTENQIEPLKNISPETKIHVHEQKTNVETVNIQKESSPEKNMSETLNTANNKIQNSIADTGQPPIGQSWFARLFGRK